MLEFHYPPYIIEITNDTTKYVVAHADYPGKKYRLSEEIAENGLLWPVGRVQKLLDGKLQKIDGAGFFIFGHVMFNNIQTLANQIRVGIGSPRNGQLSSYKIKQSHTSSVKHE